MYENRYLICFLKIVEEHVCMFHLSMYCTCTCTLKFQGIIITLTLYCFTVLLLFYTCIVMAFVKCYVTKTKTFLVSLILCLVNYTHN